MGKQQAAVLVLPLKTAVGQSVQIRLISSAGEKAKQRTFL